MNHWYILEDTAISKHSGNTARSDCAQHPSELPQSTESIFWACMSHGRCTHSRLLVIFHNRKEDNKSHHSYLEEDDQGPTVPEKHTEQPRPPWRLQSRMVRRSRPACWGQRWDWKGWQTAAIPADSLGGTNSSLVVHIHAARRKEAKQEAGVHVNAIPGSA